MNTSQPISVYTRAHALADGVLVAVSGELSRRVGFRYPVAMTAALWAIVDIDDGINSQTATRAMRLGNLLARTMAAIRSSADGDRVDFSAVGLECWAHCGPGDNGEPVITIMLQGED